MKFLFTLHIVWIGTVSQSLNLHLCVHKPTPAAPSRRLAYHTHHLTSQAPKRNSRQKTKKSRHSSSHHPFIHSLLKSIVGAWLPQPPQHISLLPLKIYLTTASLQFPLHAVVNTSSPSTHPLVSLPMMGAKVQAENNADFPMLASAGLCITDITGDGMSTLPDLSFTSCTAITRE